MIFQDKIIKILAEKGLSNSSINSYIRNLQRLGETERLTNLKFLENPEQILSQLENLKDNTKRTYLIGIVSVLDSLGKKNLYNEYYKILNDLVEKINSKPKHQKTETQKENWIEWDEVKKVWENLKEKVDKLKRKRKNLNRKEYEKVLNWMVLSFYVLDVPRRNMDYQKLYYIKEMSEDLPKNKNYLDLKNKQFIFNQYKTVKKQGQKIVDIKPELLKVINFYLKFRPNATDEPQIFLSNYEGEPLDKVNSITRILNKIFKKKIGASMLRHIFLSHTFGDTLKKQQKIADSMGHSTRTQKDYIKSDDLVVDFN